MAPAAVLWLLAVGFGGAAPAAAAGIGDDFAGARTGLLRAPALGAGLTGRGTLPRALVAKAAEEESAVEAVEKTIFIRATPDECFRVASGYEVCRTLQSLSSVAPAAFMCWLLHSCVCVCAATHCPVVLCSPQSLSIPLP
jgi:hypothetical protein